MPRQIRPGDLVEIIIDTGDEDEIAYYQVDSISDTEILVSNNDSLEHLIFNPNESSESESVRIWREFRPHQIKFLNPPILTGDPNIDLKILLYLDDQDLSAYCQVKPDECFPELWQTKIINKWGIDIYQVKPTNLSDWEYYLRLTELNKLYYFSIDHKRHTDKFEHISKFVENGDFYIVDFLDNFDISPENYLMREISNAAIYFGRTDVLDWLLSKGYGETIWTKPRFPINGGHINVLEWFHQHDLPVHTASILYPDIDYIPALEWLDDKGIEDYSSIISAASKAGRIDVLDWLYDRGYIDKFYSGGSRSDESFDWFISKQIYPGELDLGVLASRGELEKLKFLAEQGILPSEDAASMALYSDHEEIVRWMLELGISPNQRAIDDYFLSYPFNPERAEFLAELGLWPSSVSADRAITETINGPSNYEDHLNWLYHHNIYVSDDNPSWWQKLFYRYGIYRIRIRDPNTS